MIADLSHSPLWPWALCSLEPGRKVSTDNSTLLSHDLLCNCTWFKDNDGRKLSMKYFCLMCYRFSEKIIHVK